MIDQRHPGQTERLLANLLQLGVVAAVDYPVARVRVTLDGVASAWLPWLTPRAGGDRTWAAPEIGEQVLIACPDGDPANGVIVGALYQQAHAAPAATAEVTRTVYADGAVIDYDRAAHRLTATLPAGGQAAVTAPGGLTVTGPVTVNGNLTLTGTVSITGATTITGNTTVNGQATVTQRLNANGGLGATAAPGQPAMQLAGDLAVTGALTTTGDQVANGISQSAHVHTGVQTGTGLTGAPKP